MDPVCLFTQLVRWIPSRSYFKKRLEALACVPHLLPLPLLLLLFNWILHPVVKDMKVKIAVNV